MVTVKSLPVGAHPLTEQRLHEFERRANIMLPPTYRNFLLTHNGGKVSPSVFHLADQDDSDILSVLYGIDTARGADLEIMWEQSRGRMPDHILPIGNDPFGNLICLAISGPHTGKIYFWDHEQEHDPKRSLSFLANSFDEFLNSLTEDEDEDE